MIRIDELDYVDYAGWRCARVPGTGVGVFCATNDTCSVGVEGEGVAHKAGQYMICDNVFSDSWTFNHPYKAWTHLDEITAQAILLHLTEEVTDDAN